MPLQDYMQILSVDDHLIEPPRVFIDRLPRQHLEMGPRIIEDEKGHHVWTFEGRRYPQIGLNAVAGKDAKDYGTEPVRYEVDRIRNGRSFATRRVVARQAIGAILDKA